MLFYGITKLNRRIAKFIPYTKQNPTNLAGFVVPYYQDYKLVVVERSVQGRLSTDVKIKGLKIY